MGLNGFKWVTFDPNWYLSVPFDIDGPSRSLSVWIGPYGCNWVGIGPNGSKLDLNSPY